MRILYFPLLVMRMVSMVEYSRFVFHLIANSRLSGFGGV